MARSSSPARASARPNLESAVPVTSVGGDELFETAAISVGDVLNELPQLRNTFSQANSTRFLGTARPQPARSARPRHAAHAGAGQRPPPRRRATSSTTRVSPDINTIPTDLIERVDVVTGGDSAVYGSDAIAGVVNFILKDNYDGLQVRGQGGISNMATRGNHYVSAPRRQELRRRPRQRRDQPRICAPGRFLRFGPPGPAAERRLPGRRHRSGRLGQRCRRQPRSRCSSATSARRRSRPAAWSTSASAARRRAVRQPTRLRRRRSPAPICSSRTARWSRRPAPRRSRRRTAASSAATAIAAAKASSSRCRRTSSAIRPT